MLEHLFGSKTRYRLLRFFFHNAESAFYVRQLTRVLDVQINAIRRELALLVKSGLVEETTTPGHVDNAAAGAKLRKYYRLNMKSVMYGEMQELLMKGQILDEQAFVEHIKEKCGTICLLLLTGRFSGDREVESDLLIVGKIKTRNLEHIVKGYEKDIGFEIRYTFMTEEEFFERRQMMDKFIFSLFEAKKIMIINELGI